jgi:hypothetical protein
VELREAQERQKADAFYDDLRRADDLKSVSIKKKQGIKN